MVAKDAAHDFFEGLATRGREPALARAEGTLRFDLADGQDVEHWLVRVDKGEVSVTHGEGSADIVLRGDKDLFNDIVTGRANAMCAVLRGGLSCEGDLSLAVLFQRMFPGPTPANAPPTAHA